MNSLALVFVLVISLMGCGSNSDNHRANPDGVGSESVNDSPNPYPVSDEERAKSVEKLVELRKKMLLLEGKLIAPATEDLEAYFEFLEEPETGMARLFPRNPHNEKRPLLVRGGGSYYQFKGRTNEYGYGSDIQYDNTNEPSFSIGFAGVDYGFLGQLGKLDIRGVDASNSAVAFALNHQPPHNQPEPEWREQQHRWSRDGAVSHGITFKDKAKAVVGMSYVVRSVNENGYDIVAVFQVVRRDNTDGSLVLAWRIIEEFEEPTLRR